MTFLQSIKTKVAKAAGQAPPWGDVNPLVTIGLTEAVLDLGLTEEQMYPVVRGFLRQLAAQVHPDKRPTGAIVTRQQQILDALNYLDDREHFARALDDFRTLKAEDRREVSILSRTVNALRAQISEVDQKAAAVRADRTVLENERQAFLKQKQQEVLQVPQLRNSLQSTEYSLSRSEKFLAEARLAYRKWLRRFRNLELYISNLGAETSPSHPLTFEAKWIVLAFLSWDDAASEMIPLDQSGEPTSEFLKAARSAGIPKKRIPEIIKAWQQAVNQFGRPDAVEAKVLQLTLCILKMVKHRPQVVFGDKLAIAGGRVIGSIPANDKMPFVRKDLTNSQGRWKVLEQMLPLVIPGGILVSAVQEKKGRSKDPLAKIYNTTVFYTKRVVLAAG